jgi:hypothetical protein
MRGRPQSSALLDCAREGYPRRSTCTGRRRSPRGPADGSPIPSSNVAIRSSHFLDRAIPSGRARSPSRHRRGLDRWNHDGRATRTPGIGEGYRVVGRVPRDARDAAVDCLNQLDRRRRVIDSGLGQRVSDDDTRAVDPDGASSSLVCRVFGVSRQPIPLRQESRGPCCRR